MAAAPAAKAPRRIDDSGSGRRAAIDVAKQEARPVAGREGKDADMQRFAVVFRVVVAPGLACAAELLRCVAADGAVSYQDTPCGAGSRLTKTIAVPERRCAESES